MPLKFLADVYHSPCIKCRGCEAICRNYNQVPEGVFRIKVVTINEGKPGQLNFPLQCLHCNDPPCMKVCPVNAIWKREEDGVVLVKKDICIGCGYCASACPFGAPQFRKGGVMGLDGKMDKCTYCVQPYDPKDEEGKEIFREPKPRCAMVCPTGTIVAGEQKEIVEMLRKRAAEKMAMGQLERVFLFF